MRFLIWTFLILTGNGLFSQTVSPRVISSSGSESKNQRIQLHWTLGEAVIDYNVLDNHSISLGFQFAPKPDLLSAISLNSEESSFQRNSQISINCLISNSGPVSISFSFENAVYLSSDTLISENDILIDRQTIKSLASSDSIDFNVTYHIPVTIDTGNYYLICMADTGNFVLEDHEENNLSYTPIQIFDQPDLNVVNLTLAPDTVFFNASADISGEVTNSGTIQAPESILGIFISNDPELSGDDIIFDQVNVPVLNPGQSFSYSDEFVPSALGLSPGMFYLFFCPDSDDQLDETVDDNCRSLIFWIVENRKPDLLVNHLELGESCILPGDNVTLSFDLFNLGMASAASSQSGIYLSDNPVLDEDDLYIDMVSHPSNLGPGDSMRFEKKITITVTTTPGDWFLIVCADYQNQIMESEEQNNCHSVEIAVRADASECKPDIVVQNVSVDADCIREGSNIDIYYTLMNRSIVSSGRSSYVDIHLSKDAVINENDHLLKRKWVPAIEGTSSHNLRENLFLPVPISGGTYHIIVSYDLDERILEENEDNNDDSDSFTVLGQGKADLEISGFEILDECLYYNSAFGVKFRISNKGISISDASKIEYYISTDPSYSADDIQIYGHDILPIQPCDYTDFEEILYLTGIFKGGTYFLIAQVDPMDQVDESNESNNTAFGRTTIKTADIVLGKDTTGMVDVLPGEFDNFKINLSNIGNLDAGPFYTGAYLSADEVCDSTDVLIAYMLTGPLPAGQDDCIYLDVPIPDEEGSIYFLIFKANFIDSIIEGDLSNNECALKINIKEPEKPEFDLIEFYYFQEAVGDVNPLNKTKNE